MSDEYPIRFEPTELLARGNRPKRRVDAEAFAAGQKVRRTADRLRDDQRPVRGIVQRDFLPEPTLSHHVGLEAGIREFGTEPNDRRVEILGDTVEPVGEVDLDVVSVRHCCRVAFVAIEQRDYAGDCAELREQLVDSVGVDGIDDPDLAVDLEGVARAAHSLVGVGDPPDAAVEPVDDLEVGRSFVDTGCHTVPYGRRAVK